MTPQALAMLIQMATAREDSPARALARAHLSHIAVSWLVCVVAPLIGVAGIAIIIWRHS